MKIYKCPKCGTIVELLYKGGCEPSCCGDGMQELKANTTDAATEKHVPVVKVEGSKVLVDVGSVQHPMTEEHSIQFVAVEAGNEVLRRDLKPTDAPKAEFELGAYHGPITVYEYCNLHGLWKADAEV